MLKRFLDIGASVVGLAACAPLMLVAAVLVKCTSPGPVFFRQQRIGRYFKPFKILKFRTMVVDAPHMGLPITAAGDPRVTPVGRVLRKYKVDELPQLFNVLVGDMSFVGPRPEVLKYVEMFREDFAELLQIRPGITDAASLEYADESEVLAASDDCEATYIRDVLPKKIQLGKEYLRDAGLWRDVSLIVRTVLKIVGLGVHRPHSRRPSTHPDLGAP